MTMKANLRRSAVARLLLPVAVAAITSSLSLAAQAQIKQPGAHPKYEVEVEPHLLLQINEKLGASSGWGPGIRLSIPFLDNGPISKINNSMAISFGMDWAHFSNACRDYWWAGRPKDIDPYWYDKDCSANQYWFPVNLQWNFFLTDKISVFGEPGLALRHYSWSYWARCNSPDGWCEVDSSDTDLMFTFWAGARFHLFKGGAITVRLGSPSVSAGVSLFF